jgi:hypothetical protein
MHRYRIVAQITLILSVLNLALAAPVLVSDVPEAAVPTSVAPEAEVPAAEVPEASDDPGPSGSQDTMAPPQHARPSLDQTSGYHVPHVSEITSV